MSDVVFDRMLFDHLDKVTDQTNRIAALEEEIARLRLTDEERRAVEDAIHHWGQCADSLRGLPTDVRIEAASRAATLRALLERLGGER